MNRNQRAKVAQQTLEILELGEYVNCASVKVDIRDAVDLSVGSSKHYTEADLTLALNETKGKISEFSATDSCQYLVENCTTFAGVKSLLKTSDNVVCLNFASAKNPGGGFLGGSQAQEEALTRASALYPCLSKHMDMYLSNRKANRLLYSHDMIYAKDVPVFRDDRDNLLDEAYKASIITAAAVNAGNVLRKQPDSQDIINREMLNRARYVLSVAAVNGYRDIVLGAWGCGVFKNDPAVIADIFYRLLQDEGFKYLFDKVFFAVLDHSKDKSTYISFRDRF